jgi:hypothetical protein
VPLGIRRFYDLIAEEAKARGYKFILYLLEDGDQTWIDYEMLHTSWLYKCPLPGVTFVTKESATLLAQIQTFDVEYDEYPENVYTSSALYIITCTIPLFVVALALLYASTYSLWKSGFPFVRKEANWMCLMAMSLALAISKCFCNMYFVDFLDFSRFDF